DAMRCLIRRDVDGTRLLARLQIDDRDLVSWVGVAAVDTVAVDRHIRGFVIGRNRDVVRRDARLDARKLRARCGIEEADVASDLIDENQTSRAGRIVRVGVSRSNRARNDGDQNKSAENAGTSLHDARHHTAVRLKADPTYFPASEPLSPEPWC